MNYLCCKFSDCSFGSFVRTNRHTEIDTQTDAGELHVSIIIIIIIIIILFKN